MLWGIWCDSGGGDTRGGDPGVRGLLAGARWEGAGEGGGWGGIWGDSLRDMGGQEGEGAQRKGGVSLGGLQVRVL